MNILNISRYQVIEIEPKFHDDFNEIENLQESYDFLKSSRTGKSQILVSPSESKLLQGTLENLNISYEIINRNILSDILKEKEDNDIFCVSARLGTDCYRSHSEINNYIEDLYQRYPNRTFVKQVGYSYERRPLKTITITNGDGRKNKKVNLKFYNSYNILKQSCR